MTKYTNKHSAVVAMLKQAIDNHGYNITDLQEKTGVTRSQLYRWINGDAKNIQQKSFQAVAHNLGYVINHAEDGIEVIHHIQQPEDIMDTQKDTMIDNQQKLINIYESQITQLENQNKVLESSQTRTVESVLYDQLTWDWITTVDVKISLTKGITRRIYDLQNIEKMAQSLDTTIDIILPYFDVPTFHKMYDHPINQIITKESLKALRYKTDTFLAIIKDGVKKGMQTLDFFLGNHYITIFIDYELNGESCKTITHCKIIKKGVNTLTIQNKIQLLAD
tara:strand:- start:1650 stop:2483 length:834 start_codon:yes stop_codon:yes gene_type:complete